MSDIDTRIRAAVDRFVAELSELLRAATMDQVTHALGGERRVRRARPRRGSPPGQPKGPYRNASELEQLKARVLAAIEKHPGARRRDLAAVTGLSLTEVRHPALQLVKAGKVRRTGNTRASRYYAR